MHLRIGTTVQRNGITGTIIDFDRYTFAQPMFAVQFPHGLALLQACEIGIPSWTCSHAACIEARQFIGRCFS